MNPRSIGFRLTVWYSLTLAATLTAVSAGGWWAVRKSIHETVDQALRARLLVLGDYLKREAIAVAPSRLAEELAEQAEFATPGTGVRIGDGKGHWLLLSPGSADWGPPLPPPAALSARGAARTLWVRGKPVRVLSARVSLGVVELGEPLEEFYEMLDGFTWSVLVGSPLLLLAAAAGGYAMSRRALQPVDEIARAADAIGARNLSERLPLRGTGDELDQLSTTLNGMFGRLESAFRRISQFSADASHELRTPLAIMRTTAELARSRQRSVEEYEQALDRILAESERTSGLLDDLLLLARSDAGVAEFDSAPLALDELVRAGCEEARVLAEAAAVRLDCDAHTSVTVRGDAHALRRLLLILLDNALKYTQAGGTVHVTLRLAPAQSGLTALLEVRDSGIGIPAEDLPHIFERFYRAAKDRSRSTGGVGLGLSIAQCIAIRHAGRLSAESVPGQGSTFQLHLPV